jgi:hypothetical protein
MPYITQHKRIEIMQGKGSTTPGELNFTLTTLCSDYAGIPEHLDYTKINEIIGVLECIKLEFYRRVAIPFEEKKIQINGDVYHKGNCARSEIGRCTCED